jgi:transposase
MVRRHISKDLKEMALSMSLQGLGDSEIREYTGISERSLKRLRRTHRETGTVAPKPVATGRPRMLTSMEVKVCCVFCHIGLCSCPLSFFVTALHASLT